MMWYTVKLHIYVGAHDKAWLLPITSWLAIMGRLLEAGKYASMHEGTKAELN